MFVRGTRYLVVAVCVFALAQTTQANGAIFSGSITMDDIGLGDLNNVAQGAGVTLDVAATVNYNLSDPGNDINVIQLDFSDSTQDLSGASWAWNSAVSSVLTLFPDDSMSGDEYVTRKGTSGLTTTPFDIGILTFNAPGTNGTYTVYLTGGTSPDITLMADGVTFISELHSNLTLGTFTFTVVPEPATMAVLGCGGLLVLLRKKRRG